VKVLQKGIARSGGEGQIILVIADWIAIEDYKIEHFLTGYD